MLSQCIEIDRFRFRRSAVADTCCVIDVSCYPLAPPTHTPPTLTPRGDGVVGLVRDRYFS